MVRGKNFTLRDRNEIASIERDLAARGENILTTVDNTRDQVKLYYWVAMHGWSTALQIKKASKLQRDGAPMPPPQYMQLVPTIRYQPRVYQQNPRPAYPYQAQYYQPNPQQQVYAQFLYAPGYPARPKSQRGRGRGKY